MGLYVHSLGEIPTGAERAYYVYLLDYGWEECLAMPFGEFAKNGRHGLAFQRGSHPRPARRAFRG